MKWIKKGLIFDNGEQRAQMPTALVMKDRIRIYYNIRDAFGGAHIRFIDVDKKNPKKILGKSKKEVLCWGYSGAFDDAGVMPSWVDKTEDTVVWMYYIGTSLAKDVPYKCQVGVATSSDGGETFMKHGTSRETTNPFLATTPCEIEGEVFYAGGKGWIDVGGKLEPLYTIHRKGIECIKPKTKHEANCRPSIIRFGDTYKMWFSARDSFNFRGGKGSYKMGYAESKNLISWKRDDKKAGLDVGKKGEWDSEMVAYPNIINVDGKYLMFYNGNGFGKSGIGYAVLDQ